MMHGFIRLPDVKARTALSRSTIYKRVADGTFPPPVRLGARAAAWVEEEIAVWIASQIENSRGRHD